MSYKEIKNHLLDLGKRNRLLNYKETGYKSISIMNDNYDTIYKNIVNSKIYKIPFIEPILNRQMKLTTDNSSSIASYSKAKVCDIMKPVCKPNELICYKEGISQAKILKSLYKEYKFSINEKGINSLYMAFGFISYEEGLKAPLLLIPLSYIRNNKNEFSLSEAEDEIILNPTLAYYFKQEYKITLPTIIDEDEKLSDYFKRVEATLPENMALIRELAFGIFSFLKMNMYDDLNNNEAKVLANKNIRSLILNEKQEVNLSDDFKALPVKDCDSSQLKAIKLAQAGNSFVLQGPPGSGKSQTITNIISSLIGSGKRVLFVSEKMAALQVVFNNLRKVGLSDFALELHSSKANKKEFIDELYRTATLPRYNLDNKTDNDLEKYEAYREYLEEYQNDLFKAADGSLTLYDLIMSYLDIDSEELNYNIDNISALSVADMNIISEALNKYNNYIKPLGYNYKEMIFDIFNEISYDDLNYRINNEIEESLVFLNSLKGLKDSLNKYININGKGINSINELFKSLDLIDKLNNLKIKNKAYFDEKTRSEIIKSLESYKSLEDNLGSLGEYDKEILKLDLEPMYRYIRGTKSLFAHLFDKKYKEYKRTILGYKRGKSSYKELLNELPLIIEYKNKLNGMKKEYQGIAKYLGKCKLKDVIIDLKETKGFTGYSVDFSNTNLLTDALINARGYNEANLKLASLNRRLNHDKLDIYGFSLDLVYAKLKELYLKRNDLKLFYLVKESLNEIDKYKATGFLDKYLEEGKPLDKLRECYKKTFLRNKILNSFSLSPILQAFDSSLFNDQIASFIRLDKLIQTINRDIIIATNSKKRPDDMVMGGAFSILAHEYNKLKRKKPIRYLMDNILDFILDLKPVLLMSPLSVSTYLPADTIFDAVIFDEASQIFAWDALGAIYRAKQCIIIGDSKQMPPSSFFSSLGDDLEDEDSMDLESILDLASSTILQASLKWHYRSRSEELIEFSNKYFYDHTLITIPSAKQRGEGLGLEMVYLENGRYDQKTRTNLIEANKVCDLVIEHVKNSDKSLGVVAFSEVQANLIEALLEERIAKDKSLAKYFNEEVEEPFFIKNLETVQGDERDRIIFSICYGYNENNKFYQRFGPLNNLGGERRLNVAITRAKYNVTLVSSIRYNDIKPSASLGCRLLYEYLKYAAEREASNDYGVPDNPISKELSLRLSQFGYNVVAKLGTSSFKIDLAIKRKNEANYFAAIIFDNEEKLKHNVSDSFRLEKSLLERQGFKYYRLFIPAWFNNKELELNRILEFLDSDYKREEIKEIDNSYLEINNEVSHLEDELIDYKKLDTRLALDTLKDEGADIMVKKIIEYEAPITKEYLYKRVSTILGKKSVTAIVKNLVDSSLNDDIIIRNDAYYINPNIEVSLRINSDRSIDLIPVDELMDGLYRIVKDASYINRHDAYKRLNQILGFKRVTEGIKERLNSCVIFLQLEGKIKVNGDGLSA